MIRLTVRRLPGASTSEAETIVYTVRLRNGDPIVTSDGAEIAKELARLGVEDAEQLIAQARQWREIEVPDPRRG